MMMMSDLILAAIGAAVVLTIVFASFPNDPDSVFGEGTQLRITPNNAVHLGATLVFDQEPRIVFSDDGTPLDKPAYFRNPTKLSSSRIVVMFDKDFEYSDEVLYFYLSDAKRLPISEAISVTLWLRGPGVQREFRKFAIDRGKPLLRVFLKDLSAHKGIDLKDVGWVKDICAASLRAPEFPDCKE